MLISWEKWWQQRAVFLSFSPSKEWQKIIAQRLRSIKPSLLRKHVQVMICSWCLHVFTARKGGSILVHGGWCLFRCVVSVRYLGQIKGVADKDGSDTTESSRQEGLDGGGLGNDLLHGLGLCKVGHGCRRVERREESKERRVRGEWRREE